MATRTTATSSLLTLLLAHLTTLHQVSANFKVETSSLRIDQPEAYKGKYDVALANFGVPLYGGSLKGVLVYPPTNRYGCVEFGDDYQLPKHPGFATVLLLDRGGPNGNKCKFVVKTDNAQKLGANALLVISDHDRLTTMDSGGDDASQEIVEHLSIPAGLITKTVGESLKDAVAKEGMVIATLDWTDSLPHPDDRVEWEFWTNSNDACGVKCDQLKEFESSFASTAQALEKGGYTQFTPHYVTWLCPDHFKETKECKSQCINHGRYCAPDPDDDLTKGYDGKDVVGENLRQLCFFQLANQSATPWLYWDYVNMFGKSCTMSSGHYNRECSENVFLALGGNNLEGGLQAWRDCIGDVTADTKNSLLDSEQKNQEGTKENGHTDISIVPTVLINNAQYRGRLEKNAVLKALCAGFSKNTEPEVCNGKDVSENECEEGNIGERACKANVRSGRTKCINTFRGYECGCLPGYIEDRVDGMETCAKNDECKRTALTLDRCTGERSACRNMPGSDPPFECEDISNDCLGPKNGGCWSKTIGGDFFSACQDNLNVTREAFSNDEDIAFMANHTCKCPSGFRKVNDKGGDSFECEDIDECKTECKGAKESCKNVPGSFVCTCKAGVRIDGKCVVDSDSVDEVVQSGGGASVGMVIFIIVAVVVLLGVAAYGLYKYRLQSYMRAEVRGILAQYVRSSPTKPSGVQPICIH